MKDYTYCLTVKEKDGSIRQVNETDVARGYRKSWFKTEEAARKALAQTIKCCEFYGGEILEYTLFHRSHQVGIIEEFKA